MCPEALEPSREQDCFSPELAQTLDYSNSELPHWLDVRDRVLSLGLPRGSQLCLLVSQQLSGSPGILRPLSPSQLLSLGKVVGSLFLLFLRFPRSGPLCP